MSIGAGPTILIIGLIIVSLFGAVKYSDYQQRIREYDVCAAKVDRSVDFYEFNNILVEQVERELPGSQSAIELRAALLPPLSMDDCPPPPTFFNAGDE